jgi:hypothetical protein
MNLSLLARAWACFPTKMAAIVLLLAALIAVIRAQSGDLSVSKTAGPVYVRWGRTTCPSSATLVFQGVAGGLVAAWCGVVFFL